MAQSKERYKMPTIQEVKEAASDVASTLRADCGPSDFFGRVESLASRPHHWGFPKSWTRRPNWDRDTVRTEMAAALWRLPSHPARIARAYRGLPFRVLRDIADGRIKALWPDAPSGAMRHEWLCATAANRRYRGHDWQKWLDAPWAWYCRHCPIGGFEPRSRAIAEWLVAKKTWAGWHRPLPVGYGPDGEMQTVRPQDLLDEVWDEDLPNGAKSNPEKVFRAVLQRTSEDTLRRIAAENAPLPSMPWTEITGVEQITSGKELVAEGVRMDHCVGGYVNACRRGDCYILRLPNSTAEIKSSGGVYQHLGYRNYGPPSEDKKLLARWVASRKEKGGK